MVFRRAAGLFGGASVGHAILLLGSLAAALAFGARAFGEYSVYGGVVGIASTIAALRLEYALPRSGGASRALVLWVCLAMAVGSGLLLGLVAFLVLGSSGLAGEGSRSAVGWAALLALGVSGNCAMGSLRLWLLTVQHIRLVAWLEALRATAQVAAWSVAFFVAASGEALALGHALACWGASALALAWGAGNRRRIGAGLRQLRRPRRWPRVRACVGPHLRLLLYGAPAAVINASVLHGIVLALGGLFGSGVAGNYSFAQRITTKPATLISRAVAEACMSSHVGSRARLWAEIAGTFRRWSMLVVALGVPAAAAAVGAWWLWGDRAAGTDWSLLPVCLAVLIPTAIAQLAAQPWGALFMVAGESGRLLAWDASRLGLVVALALVLAGLGGDATTAIVAVAAIMIGTYAALWTMVLRRTRRNAVGEVGAQG